MFIKVSLLCIVPSFLVALWMWAIVRIGNRPTSIPNGMDVFDDGCDYTTPSLKQVILHQ